MRGAGILGLVDPVAEAHDLLAPAYPVGGLPARRLDRVTGRGPGNRLQPPHDLLVGPAVQRPLERADGGDHRGVHVGQGCRADAGRERGRVHRVVSVQDEAGIEDLRLPLPRPPAGDLQKEVRGKPQLRVSLAGLGPERAFSYPATSTGCCATSLTALRWFASGELESLSGSSALASETRVRSASIGSWLRATSARLAVTSLPGERPAAISAR